MRGEIGRAIRIHQNLLLRTDLAPDRKTTALFDLAQDFRQGGFLRRAIASFEEVLARSPRHLGALQALEKLLAEVREYPRALEVTRQRARAEGRPSAAEEAALLVEMARAARSEGRGDEARKAVKRALRRDRTSVAGWVLLGEIEAERGRSKAAVAAWRKVPELDARSGRRVFPQLESTYAALGRARDFEALLQGLLEKRPDDAAARLALAGALAARGAADEAAQQLRQLLEHDADDLEARGALGRLLLSERRDTEAAAELSALLDALDRRGLLCPREKLE